LCLNVTAYPFSPYSTKQLTMAISSAGTVTVKPNSGANTHVLSGLTCQGPYFMRGYYQAPGALLPESMYVITFSKFTIPDNPH
jgi:hypothetical protein